MLSTWEGHATVDPARIGMFGFSADGFTTLVSIGAAPDYRVLPDAGHFDFLVPCSPALASLAPAICAGAVGFDRAAFHTSFNAALTNFFSETLKAGSRT